MRKCRSNFDDSVHKRDTFTLSIKRAFDHDKELHTSFKKLKVAKARSRRSRRCKEKEEEVEEGAI